MNKTQQKGTTPSSYGSITKNQFLSYISHDNKIQRKF